MIDQYGRDINYMRLSITDRCNLRCRYCMPNGVQLTHHNDILTYSEIFRICKASVGLGIVNYKITGGEPLVRKGCVGFITDLKKLSGVKQVTLTTNGLLLEEEIDELIAVGIDGINISLDTTDENMFRQLTGFSGNGPLVIQRVLKRCVDNGVKVKLNAVLLEAAKAAITQIAGIAQQMPVDVRFIELMPIGEGSYMEGMPMDEALRLLQAMFTDLQEVNEKRGNGPAHYYASKGLKGRIGFISSLSHNFCNSCNRLRLTAVGKLKPCLCYYEGVDLKTILRNGCTDDELMKVIKDIVLNKPKAHCFGENGGVTESGAMNGIGG